MSQSPGVLWIKAAVVYFIMGVGPRHLYGRFWDHLYVPVHAHLNLHGTDAFGVIGGRTP